jgi:hypothetical protein
MSYNNISISYTAPVPSSTRHNAPSKADREWNKIIGAGVQTAGQADLDIGNSASTGTDDRGEDSPL